MILSVLFVSLKNNHTSYVPVESARRSFERVITGLLKNGFDDKEALLLQVFVTYLLSDNYFCN